TRNRTTRRAPPGDHADGSRKDIRPDRGAHLPRRTVARSALHDAAGPRLGPIPDADRRIVFVRRGDASWLGDHRRLGTERRARDHQEWFVEPTFRSARYDG